MNHPKTPFIVFQILIFYFLTGYGKIVAQDVISTARNSIWSNIIDPIDEYSASISGSTAYCQGVSMPIILTITAGIAPYAATLTRSNSSSNKDTTINNIISSPYTIQVKISGSYTLKSLIDANSDPAELTGDPVVLIANPKPNAVLTGTQGICNDGVAIAPLSLNLKGTAPWAFIIRRGASNDTTYSGIAADPFTINARVIGSSPTTYRMISLSDANCTGDTVGSGIVRVYWITSPTAVLSGRDTICPGQTGTLKVTLTGVGPWSITYLRNGSNPTIVNNITNFSYDLQVQGTGTYTLSRVEDAVCTGRVSGTGIVTNFTVPTGIISGTATICEHTSTNLNIALTGSFPWKFSYRRNSETPVEVLNVTTTPKTVPVRYTGTYILTEVYDRNCAGTVSGSATINVTEAPEVEIIGLAPGYAVSTVRVPVFASPVGGTYAYHPALIDPPPPDTMFFYPIVAGVGTHNIIYSYRSPSTLCYGYDTAVVRVLAAIATIIFEDDRTKYCNNDQPFTVEGVNLAGAIGSFSGVTGLIDHGDNTATIYPALLNAGDYTITYRYFDGTWLEVKAEFEVGNKPIANFNWESECFHQGQSIAINDASSSTFGFINHYEYKIFTNTGYDILNTKDIEYTFPQLGNYTIELQVQTSYGCVDIATKTFEFKSPSFSNIVVSTCESHYTSPSGKHTWTTSGIYIDTIPNFAGCDSIITINLTMNNKTTSSINRIACEEYTSPSGKYTWIYSGIYLDTIPNAYGCDSIITINLTVSNSSIIPIDQTECYSYISPSGKHTWTTTGVYIDTIPSLAGCDSIIIINLIINSVDVSVDISSVGQNATVLTANAAEASYQWIDCNNNSAHIDGETGRTYTPSIDGDYAVIVSENGCIDTSTCYSINISGIVKNQRQQNITLYPNPNKGSFSIDLGKVYSNIVVTITELDGRIIQKENFNNARLIELMLSTQPGLYLLILNSENERMVFRIVRN